VLVESGNTKILCTVTSTDYVPPWRHNQGMGWLTAEYSMLPGSTHSRKQREGRNHRVDGRSLEIQRLIGRSLRSIIDLKAIPEITLWIDCDVLAADGGTRTAAINGACVALYDALLYMEEKKEIRKWPLSGMVNAMSVGMIKGQPAIDLDYGEDSGADVDMNVVCTSGGQFVEVQGSAERTPFSQDQFVTMLELARSACAEVEKLQKAVLGL
jgi:ribonuclease PH